MTVEGRYIPDGFAHRAMKAQIVKRVHQLFVLGPFVEPDGAHDQIIQLRVFYLGWEPSDRRLLR